DMPRSSPSIAYSGGASGHVRDAVGVATPSLEKSPVALSPHRTSCGCISRPTSGCCRLRPPVPRLLKPYPRRVRHALLAASQHSDRGRWLVDQFLFPCSETPRYGRSP